MRAAPPARSPVDTFRSPILSLIYAGACLAVAYPLYLMSQHGQEWGTAGVVATAGMAISQVVKAINDNFKLRLHRKKLEKFREEEKEHGQARWGTWKDIEKSKTLSGKQGVFLGTIQVGRKEKKVFWDGEGTLGIIARPSQLKSLSIVAPTLFGDLGQNAIVNDPSGEIYSIVGSYLRSIGVKTEVLTPCPDKVNALLGDEAKVTDSGLDVFSSITLDMDPRGVKLQLEMIMKIVMPGKANMDEKSEYFYRSGQELGIFYSMKELDEGRWPTLPAIRHHIKRSLMYLEEHLHEAEGSTSFGGSYRELAESIYGLYSAAPQQLAGAIGVAEQCLGPYDSFSLMGQHVSKENSFDPSVLSHPTQRSVVFLISTLEMMETMAPTTAMTLNYLLNALAADGQEGRCTAIIDECGSLNMPSLPSKLLMMRKVCRFVLIFQDLQGQALKKHGRAGMQEILAACEGKLLLGSVEPETLKLFSTECGTRSLMKRQLNDRAVMTSAMPDLSPNLSHESLPLIRSDELYRLPTGKLVASFGNEFPLMLNKLPYWRCPEWNAVAGPSPYYRG